MKITSGLALVIHGAKKKGKMQMAGDKNEKKRACKKEEKSARIEKEIDGLLFFISRENISDTPQSSSRLRRGNTPKKSLNNRQTKCTDFTSPSAFSWPYTQTSRCVSERGGCSHSSTLSPSGTRLVRRRRPLAASRARVSRWPSVCLRAAPCPATVPQVGRVSRFHLRVSGFIFQDVVNG